MSGGRPANASASASSKAATTDAIGSSSRRIASDSASACAPPRLSGEEWTEGRATPVTRSGAERVGGERRGQRGVDAAREADDDAGEPVLVDVVGDAGAQRRPHLGLVVEGVGHERLRQRRARAVARRRARDDGRGHEGRRPGRRRPSGSRSRRRAETAGSMSATSRCSANWGAAGEHLAGRVEHRRAPVEDELVLAAHLVAEGERGGAVVGAGGEHPLAPVALAAMVRRGRDAADQVDPGGGEVGRDRVSGTRCPRRPRGRCASRRPRAPSGRRPRRSSAPRRRPRSSAGSACGRRPGRARRRARPRRCDSRRPSRGSRRPRRPRRTPPARRSTASRAAARECGAQQQVLGRVAR